MRLLSQRAASAAARVRRVGNGLGVVANTIELPYSGALTQEAADRAAKVVEEAAEELYRAAEMLRGEADHG